MARGDVRIAITLACEDCKRRNYQTNKSKRNTPDRVTIRKYLRAPTCPTRAPRRTKIGTLTGFDAHLRARWEVGCRDAVVLWQHHSEPYRVYHDVIVQVSNDPDFIEGVATILNTDDDNSSGLGAGHDPSWLGLHWGRPIAANGVRGRHVRCHSRGNTSNEMNHFIEVEVWGRP